MATRPTSANVPLANRTRRHLVYAVVITILAVVVGYEGVLPVFRGHLMRYLAIGDEGFGLLFSIGSIAGLTSVVFGGQLIDRWGPRRVIRICLVGVGCGMLILAFGGAHFLSFAIAVGVSGLFTAPIFIAISAYLAKLFPQHRRRVISLNLASASLGGMMFPIAAEGLLYLSRASSSVSFAQVLHLPFLLSAAILIAGSFLYRGKRAPADAAPVGETRPAAWHWRDLLLPPRALLLAVLISVHGVADSTLHLWMARFLGSRSFPSAVLAPGVVLSGYALAYLLSRATLAALPDRVGRRAFLILPGLIGGSICIAGILSRNYLLTGASYALGALCWSIEYPALVSTLLRQNRKRFGAAMAASGLMTGLAMFVSMNAMGARIERLGDQQMWKVMLVPPVGFLVVGIGGLAWSAIFNQQQSRLSSSTPSQPTRGGDKV